MKKVMVLIPFILRETGKLMEAGSTVELTEEQLVRVKALSPNIVKVLGDVKKPKTKKQ